MMSVMNLNYLVSGKPPERAGNAHQNIVPYQVFACADGHVIVAVGNDSQFAKFCAAAGRPEWASDPRYAKNADRVRNRDALVPLIAAVIADAEPARRGSTALESLGVPCGPINRLDQVFADPHVVARGMRIDLPHPLAGSVPQVGVADQVFGDGARVRTAAAAARRAHGGRAARSARAPRRRDLPISPRAA